MASEQYRSFFVILVQLTVFSSFSSGLLFPSEIAIPVVTNSSSGRSKDGFPLMIHISISRYRIVLVLNELLIAPHFSSVYVSKSITIRTSNLKGCFYQGYVEPFVHKGTKYHNWNATINICKGLRGQFGNMNGHIVIMPMKSSGTSIHRMHFLQYQVYNITKFTWSMEHLHTEFPFDSSNTGKAIYSDYPFIELKVFNDKYIYESHNKSIARLEYYIADVVNQLDLLFSALDIDVVLVSMVTWTTIYLVDGYPNITEVLFNFNEYLFRQSPHQFDIAVLYSTFQDPRISGLSIQGGCCTAKNGILIGNKKLDLIFVSFVTAHEIGHTLNMQHDGTCRSDDCNHDDRDPCIMKGVGELRVFPTKWSKCSRSHIKDALAIGEYNCLYRALGSGVGDQTGYISDFSLKFLFYVISCQSKYKFSV